MNWGAFDLNLLIVFDAVMQERRVTRAGSRIGLSQPAMSHALNRLRQHAYRRALRAAHPNAWCRRRGPRRSPSRCAMR
jgi:hypothetical protein